MDSPFTGQTVCRLDIARICPPDHIMTRPCPECIALALASGVCVARERNTLINLQRVPSAWS